MNHCRGEPVFTQDIFRLFITIYFVYEVFNRIFRAKNTPQQKRNKKIKS